MAEKKITGAGCVLAAGGESRARVVLGADVRPFCVDAVQELVTGIAKSTGARIFIDGGAVFQRVLEPVRPAPAEIHFNLSGEGPADPGRDGFRILVSGGRIDFEARGRQGFFNAVYAFLERHCGFRWLWPGEDGEVYDCLDVMEVPVGETSEKPDYRWRNLMYGDMPGGGDDKWQIQEFHMRCSPANGALFNQWLRRNRMGGLKVLTGHTWGRFVNPDRYGRTHPEYFAETKGSRQASIDSFDGKHGGQLCTSNQEVIDLLVRRVRECFDRFPDLDAVSISPNDGEGFCECEACLARDIHFGNPPPGVGAGKGAALSESFRDDADATGESKRITGPITDRIFEFANRIAAEIAVSHPDKMLLLLVYSVYREPPRQVKLADSIIAQFCVSCHQHWAPEIREKDYQAVSDLAKMSGATGIYEYYDQGAWPGATRSFPDLIADSVRFFHGIGVQHYSVQASTGMAANGFNLWFLARALWDTGVRVDPLLDEYCRKAFTGAAGPMRRYLELWRRRWQECRGITGMGSVLPGSGPEGEKMTPFEQVLRLYPPDFMARAGAELEAARRAVEPLSAARRRIEFVGRALEGTRIMLDAARVSYALGDRGWPLKSVAVTEEAVRALGPRDQVLGEAKEALKRWARWEAFLESVRDDFVFSFFWARYCFDARKTMHPHHALGQIVAILEGGGPAR